MNCEDARTRFVDYWRGTLQDMDEFRGHLESCERCRVEAVELKDVWGTLGALPDEDPSMRLRVRFYDSLRTWRQRESQRQNRFWWLRHPAFQAACALALLAIGAGSGYLMHGRDTSEVSQLRGEVYNMRQLVALSLMQQQSASDRMRGVSFAYRVEQSDPQVLSALLTTINHDPNINVRLSAVDAMRNFTDSPVARKGLAQALAKQSSPLVQIAILDQIVEIRDKSAIPSIEVVMTPALSPEVRQHAQWALKQLQ